MRQVELICVGRLKERYFREACAEYEKRLSAYCRLHITELADEKTPAEDAAALRMRVLEKEGARVLAQLRDTDLVCALDVGGKRMDSPAFAAYFGDSLTAQAKRLVFVIGGSLGLSEAVLLRADETVSLSDMTFPHMLARIMLLEQIYRGYRIRSGEPYHK